VSPELFMIAGVALFGVLIYAFISGAAGLASQEESRLDLPPEGRSPACDVQAVGMCDSDGDPSRGKHPLRLTYYTLIEPDGRYRRFCDRACLQHQLAREAAVEARATERKADRRAPG
jgi:hypothetical protein